jgi:hypothetical protein
MKNSRTLKYGLAMAALLLAGTSLSFADTITNIVSYSDGFDIAPPNGIGQGIGREWGPGSAAWSATEGIPAGSVQINAVFGSSSDTASTAFICKGDWGNPWNTQYPITVSDYDTLEFDLKWDNTSDITIDQFNDLSTWGQAMTNINTGAQVMQSWAGETYLSGSIPGIEITLCGGPAGQMAPSIWTTNIPAAAASGWVHMVIPINKGQANIDGVAGIVFHKWINKQWGIQNSVRGTFFVDNVMFIGTAAPPPPPTVSVPTKATRGLNVFASTEGNGYWDRQSAVHEHTGLSWVGHATESNPVEYSFTICGYPNSVNCEAYLFLVPNPNPAYVENAPDWNATNCAIAYLQGSSSSATMHFQYKVNESSQQAMYSGGTEARGSYTNAPGSWDGVTTPWLESGNLGAITNSTGVLGTWTIRFTSDTNVTLIAPDLTTTTCVLPSYNAPYFTGDVNFRVYLGMQANNADAMNKAVVFSSFAITGVASPFSDNFLADSVLDTNNWNNGSAGGPKGVFIMPSTTALLLPWTLPDGGYSSESSSNLTDALSWTSLSGTIIPLYGEKMQLISNSDLPAGNAAFFRLVKRTFTKLQILLPGETAAPNTPSGKTGTPLAQSVGVPFDVIVNSVDANWNVVNGATDQIAFTSTGDMVVVSDPTQPSLSGGTVTASVEFLSGSGSATITATDNTDGSKTADTSSPVSY